MPIIKTLEINNDTYEFYKQFIIKYEIKNPRTNTKASIKYVIEMVLLDFKEEIESNEKLESE